MKILAIQNRMGIGDTVIFLPYIRAISNKFGVPVSLLVKENSKANEFLNQTNYIDEIIHLERDNKINQKHDGFKGFFKLASDIKKYNFDKVFIFNSSLRYNLISRLAGIKEIFQYPLFKKKQQHLIKTAQNFIKKELDIDVDSNPIIVIENSLIENTKNRFNIKSNQINILLGIGGSGPTKRIPASKFLNFMKMAIKEYDCKFFLATGTNQEEQNILNEILNSEFKERCTPLDKIKIKEILPVIKNCNVAVCNDSSFSHLSAALDVPTICLLYTSPSPRDRTRSRMPSSA